MARRSSAKRPGRTWDAAVGFSFGSASFFFWVWVDNVLLKLVGVALTVYAVRKYPHSHAPTSGVTAGIGYALSHVVGAVIQLPDASLNLLPFAVLHWLGFGGLVWLLALGSAKPAHAEA